MSNEEKTLVQIAKTPEQYIKYGVKPNQIEPHEDGIHPDCTPPNGN